MLWVKSHLNSHMEIILIACYSVLSLANCIPFYCFIVNFSFHYSSSSLSFLIYLFYIISFIIVSFCRYFYYFPRIFSNYFHHLCHYPLHFFFFCIICVTFSSLIFSICNITFTFPLFPRWFSLSSTFYLSFSLCNSQFSIIFICFVAFLCCIIILFIIALYS